MSDRAGPFAWIAIGGFIASLFVHVAACLGISSPFGKATWALHVGIFVVWFPMLFFGNRLIRNVKQRDVWRAMFRAVPKWVLPAVIVLAVYAFFNMATTMGKGRPMSAVEQFRAFSGHWMLFYGAAAAVLFSVVRLGDGAIPRCPQGHESSPFARFCDECGAAISDDRMS